MPNVFNVLDGGSNTAFTRTYSTTTTAVAEESAPGPAPTNVMPYGFTQANAVNVSNAAYQGYTQSLTALKLVNSIIDLLQAKGLAR